MHTICAWCQKPIGEATPEEVAGPISHGLCLSCKERFFTQPTQTLRQFLNQLDPPILVVDGNGVVQDGNDAALIMLGKNLDSIQQQRGGDVMECVHASLPEGCGHTAHCKACTIRRNVMETFETGNPLLRVPARLNKRTGSHVERIGFLVSTEKVRNMVLLRIDATTPISSRQTVTTAHQREQQSSVFAIAD